MSIHRRLKGFLFTIIIINHLLTTSSYGAVPHQLPLFSHDNYKNAAQFEWGKSIIIIIDIIQYHRPATMGWHNRCTLPESLRSLSFTTSPPLDGYHYSVSVTYATDRKSPTTANYHDKGVRGGHRSVLFRDKIKIFIAT